MGSKALLGIALVLVCAFALKTYKSDGIQTKVDDDNIEVAVDASPVHAPNEAWHSTYAESPATEKHSHPTIQMESEADVAARVEREAKYYLCFPKSIDEQCPFTDPLQHTLDELVWMIDEQKAEAGHAALALAIRSEYAGDKVAAEKWLLTAASITLKPGLWDRVAKLHTEDTPAARERVYKAFKVAKMMGLEEAPVENAMASVDKNRLEQLDREAEQLYFATLRRHQDYEQKKRVNEGGVS